MKQSIVQVLLLTFIFMGVSVEVSAQFIPYTGPYPENSQFKYPSMDTDIWLIRENAFPGFRSKYDDYLQYSPAAVMVGLKACGYESRSGWGRMLVSDAFSIGLMTAAVNGVKYTVRRGRPDQSARNSFPSGHTATAFTLASLMHMEYGWRSPWFSIGAYSVAAVTGISRLVNNKHWMSDIIGGALIGIGATHLGYYLADLIFRDEHLSDRYRSTLSDDEGFCFDAEHRYFDVDLMFHRRFVLGSDAMKADGLLPSRGSGVSVGVKVPVYASAGGIQAGAAIRGSAGSLETSNVYNALAGGYCSYRFAPRWEAEARLMGGYAHLRRSTSAAVDASGSGASAVEPMNQDRGDLIAGVSMGLAISETFKIKGYADYEFMGGYKNYPAIHSVLLGFGAGFYF